jgi:hypothetical protein
MKSLTVFLSLCAAILALPLHAADPNATLTKVSITFKTHNDNKDHDTILSVAIKNKVSLFLSQDLAGGDNLGGDKEFKDPSSESFDLVLKSDKLTVKDVTLPLVNIHIQPNGHDRWIFDYVVTLQFSDGSSFSSHKDGIILDQDNKDFSGVFEG